MTPPHRLKTLKGHDDHVVRVNVVYQAVDYLPCTRFDTHSSYMYVRKHARYMCTSTCRWVVQ